MQQVVKDQQDAGQIEGHALELGVHVGGHLRDGLGAEREHAAAARVRQVVEDEEQQLQVLHVQVLVAGQRTLQRVLLQCAHKPGDHGERQDQAQ